jgi:hypothetical protein
MEHDRFDALTRAWSQRRSRRRSLTLLGAACAAPFVARRPAAAQNINSCPAPWYVCDGRCIPAHHCCLDQDCRPGQTCWFGTCLGEETECRGSDDCPAFHACVGGSCLPF